MFWKTLMTTFGVLFLTELGDKTQLAVLCLAAGKEVSHWAVFIGAALALVVITLLAVFIGRLVGTYLPSQTVHRVAGGVFVILGALMLIGKF
jgi:putative Ca2+/H+ antiporter (TMEM165/GDT1 family)